MALLERKTIGPENIDHTKLTIEAGVSGLIAIVAATLFMAAVPAAGLPRVNLPQALAHVMVGTAPDMWMASLAAWAMYLTLGIGLAIAFAWGVERARPRSGAFKAIVVSMLPWMLIQTVVLPLAGYGVAGSHFSRPVGQLVVTLLASIVYGAVMGSVLRAQVARTTLPIIENAPAVRQSTYPS